MRLSIPTLLLLGLSSGGIAADDSLGDVSSGCADHRLTTLIGDTDQTGGSTENNELSRFEELERTGSRIGKISFANTDIFDTTDPKENKLLFRLANRLHIKTRNSVIENQLQFASGDCVSKQNIEESERMLRANQYLYDAHIEMEDYKDGVADVVVTTQDVWTLDFGVSASRSGGKNKTGIALKETNLFGTGTSIKIKQKSDVDRNTTKFEVANNHLGESNYSALVAYANSSDGRAYQLEAGRPFFAMDVRRAFNFSLFDSKQIDQVYNLANVVDEYLLNEKRYEVSYGWSSGLRNGWVRRFETGFVSSTREFLPTEFSSGLTTIPEDRKFSYPFVGFEVIEDRFETTHNHSQIDRTEDMFLGKRIAGRIGYSGSQSSASEDAWLGQLEASSGFGDPGHLALMLNTGLLGRWQDNEVRNLVTSASAELFWRQSDNKLFYASVSGSAGKNLDADQRLYLGGEEGLRGYPLRYQQGNKHWLLTLEQRLFTDWQPFQLLNVGAAVFFDAGQSSGSEFGEQSDLGVLKDVGIGLRLGNRRSGGGRIIHVDLAFPMDGGSEIDGTQLLISTKNKF